jgi:hypothetical protein
MHVRRDEGMGITHITYPTPNTNINYTDSTGTVRYKYNGNPSFLPSWKLDVALVVVVVVCCAAAQRTILTLQLQLQVRRGVANLAPSVKAKAVAEAEGKGHRGVVQC